MSWNRLLNEDFKPSMYNRLSFITKFLYYCIRVFFKNYFTIKFEGLENIESNVIFAPNHISYIDGFCIASIIPKDTMFNSYFVSKNKHTGGFFKRIFLKRSNIISLNENNIEKDMQLLAYLLKNGKSIFIFPEGTRSPKLGRFKKSFAILSKELDKKIVPIAIKGSKNILKNIFVTGGTLEISFLPSISPINKSYEELINETCNSIKDKLEVCE